MYWTKRKKGERGGLIRASIERSFNVVQCLSESFSIDSMELNKSIMCPWQTRHSSLCIKPN